MAFYKADSQFTQTVGYQGKYKFEWKTLLFKDGSHHPANHIWCIKVRALWICKVDNQFTQTIGCQAIAKGFHFLLHNLRLSIAKWSISKSTDLLLLFVI